MQIDLVQPQKDLGRAHRFSGEIDPVACGLPGVAGLFSVRGKAVFSHGRLLIEGRVTGEVELVCSRCLVGFRYQLDVPFSQEFRKEGDWLAGSATATGEDGDDIEFYSGDSLDLTPLLCETVLLSLPMKPICREGCRGLCPVCGKNLNNGPCGCVVEETDPRLEKLRNLLGRGGGDASNTQEENQ
ncbi:MAG: DUF177 domain-containing protein [Bacillota bacterium]